MKKKLKVDINKINAMKNIKSTMALSTSMVLATSAIAPTIALANTTQDVAEIAFEDNNYVAYEYIVEEGEYYALDDSLEAPEGDYGIATIWENPINVNEFDNNSAFNLSNNDGANWHTKSFYDNNPDMFDSWETAEYVTKGGYTNGSAYYSDKNIIYDIDTSDFDSIDGIDGGVIDPSVITEITLENLEIDLQPSSTILWFIGYNEDGNRALERYQAIEENVYEISLVNADNSSGTKDFVANDDVYLKIDFNGYGKFTGEHYIDLGLSIDTPDLNGATVKIGNASNYDEDANKVEFKGASSAAFASGNVELWLGDSKVSDMSSYEVKVVLPDSDGDGSGDYITGAGAVYIFMDDEDLSAVTDWSMSNISAIDAAIGSVNHKKFDFTVSGYDLSNEQMTTVKFFDSDDKEITDLPYAGGGAVTPSKVEVRYGSKLLKSGTDYVVIDASSYTNNTALTPENPTDAQKASLTITGAGSYEGNFTHYFNIVEDDAQWADDSLYRIYEVDDVVFGNEPNPEIKFKKDGATSWNDAITLNKGEHYELEFYQMVEGVCVDDEGITSPGVYELRAVPIGQYASTNDDGSAFYVASIYTFKVPGEIGDYLTMYPAATASDAKDGKATYSFEYDSDGTKPFVFAKDKSDKIVSESNFTTSAASGENNKVGQNMTALVYGRSDNGYTGSTSVKFNITAQPLNAGNITIKGLDNVENYNFEFTGKEIKFDGTTSGSLEIEDEQGNVIDPSDYELTYSYNTNVGTGYVYVTANESSNYSGTVSKDFEIKGASSYDDCGVGTIEDVYWTGNDIGITSSFKIEVNGTEIEINPSAQTSPSGGATADDEVDDWTITYKEGSVKNVGSYEITKITGSPHNPKYPDAEFDIIDGEGKFNVVYNMANVSYTIVGTDVNIPITTDVDSSGTTLSNTSGISTFNGGDLKPRVIVTITGGETSTPNVNHTNHVVADDTGSDGLIVTYDNNEDVGSGDYTVKVKDGHDDAWMFDNYDSGGGGTFPITANIVSGITITEIQDKDGNVLDMGSVLETGSEITPTITKATFTTSEITASAKTIGFVDGYMPELTTDYTITWSNNTKAGNATATLALGDKTTKNFTLNTTTTNGYTNVKAFTIVADNNIFSEAFDKLKTKVYFNGANVEFSTTAGSGYATSYGSFDEMTINNFTYEDGVEYEIGYETNDGPGWSRVELKGLSGDYDSDNGEKYDSDQSANNSFDYTGVTSVSKAFQIYTNLSDNGTTFISPSNTATIGEEERVSSKENTVDESTLEAGTYKVNPTFYYKGGRAIEPDLVAVYRGNSAEDGRYTYDSANVVGTGREIDESGYTVTYINSSSTGGTAWMTVNNTGGYYEGSVTMMPYTIAQTPIFIEDSSTIKANASQSISVSIKVADKGETADYVSADSYTAGSLSVGYTGAPITDLDQYITITHSGTDSDYDYVLENGKDYTITYANNTDMADGSSNSNAINKPTATIKGLGGYLSTDSEDFAFNFTISAMDVNEDNLNMSIPDQDYTGEPIELDFEKLGIEVSVVENGKSETLTQGDDVGSTNADYYIVYSDASDSVKTSDGTDTIAQEPGKGYATLKPTTEGAKKYSFGTNGLKLEFDIIADLSKAYMDLGDDSEKDKDGNFTMRYGTTLDTSAIRVYFGGSSETPSSSLGKVDHTDSTNGDGKEVEVKLTSASTNIGSTATATISSVLGGTKYIGEKSIDVKIVAADIATSEDSTKTYIKLEGDATDSKNYTGSEIEPTTVIVMYYADGNADSGTPTGMLIKGEDYDIEYDNNTDVSVDKDGKTSADGNSFDEETANRGTITITGKGNYSGTFTDYFVINPNTNLTFDLGEVADQEYTGMPVSPSVDVKIGDKTLVEGTDYEIVCYAMTDSGGHPIDYTVDSTNKFVEANIVSGTDGHIEPGLAYIARVEGLGNYKTLTAKEFTYNIVGDLANTTRLPGFVSDATRTYDGSDLTTDGGTTTSNAKIYDYFTLTNIADDKLSYDNGAAIWENKDGGYEIELDGDIGADINAGTSTWKVVPKENDDNKSVFSGERTFTITTEAVDMSKDENFNYNEPSVDGDRKAFKTNSETNTDARITLAVDPSSCAYNGGDVEPTFTIKDTGLKDSSGTVLTADTEITLSSGEDGSYDLSYEYVVNETTKERTYVKVTIDFKGNYTGSKTVTIPILEAEGALAFKAIENGEEDFTGVAIKQPFNVYSAGGVKLTEVSKDSNGVYETYSDKYIGDYTLTYNGLYTTQPAYTAPTTEDGEGTWGAFTANTGSGEPDLITPGWHSVTVTGAEGSNFHDGSSGSETTYNYLVTADISSNLFSFAIDDVEGSGDKFEPSDLGVSDGTDTDNTLDLTAKMKNGDSFENIASNYATLSEILDFTFDGVKDVDHKAVGEHSVTITPKVDNGVYIDEKTISYNIVNKLISNSDNVNSLVVTFDEDNIDSYEKNDLGATLYGTSPQNFTGSAIKPTVVLKNSFNVDLVEGTDYTIDYSNNTNVYTKSGANLGDDVLAGKSVPCMTITGEGDYSGTIKYYFEIEGESEDDAFSTSKSLHNTDLGKQTYTGKAITPTSTIYYNGATFSSSNYKRYYFTEAQWSDAGGDANKIKALVEKYDSNSTNFMLPGSYIMYVEGIGNYAGLSTAFTYDIAISLANSKLRFDYSNTGKEYNGLEDDKSNRPVDIYFTDPYGKEWKIYDGASAVIPTTESESESSSEAASQSLYTIEGNTESTTEATLNFGTPFVDYSGTKDKGTAKIVINSGSSEVDSDGKSIYKNYFLDTSASTKSLSFTVTNRLFNSDFDGSYDSDGVWDGKGEKGYAIQVIDPDSETGEVAKGAIRYTGSALKPELEIIDLEMTALNSIASGGSGETIYVTSDDYSVTYINNTNVGTASLVITGKNNYTSVLTHEFKIANTSASNVGENESESYFTFGSKNYTTAEVPKWEELNADEDHVYEEGWTTKLAGTNKGSGVDYDSDLLNGDGDFDYGTVITDQTLTYSSSKGTVASSPTVSVKFYNADTNKTVTLSQGTDYSLTYTGNTTPGKATATIKGLGNYAGALEQVIHFNVKGNLSTAAAVIDTDSIEGVYFARESDNSGYQFETGQGTTTNPNGLDGILSFLEAGKLIGDDDAEFRELKYDEDYTVSYSSNTSGGTATITFNAKGDYWSGSTKTTFKITANDIDSDDAFLAKLTGTIVDGDYTLGELDSEGEALSPKPSTNSEIVVSKTASPTETDSITSYKYTGSAMKPTLKLTYENPDGATIELIENTDYTLAYSNNTALSTANKKGTITITGKNGFSGTKLYAYFDIVPNNSGVIIDSSLYPITNPAISSKGIVSVSPTVYGLVGTNWTKLTNNTHYTVKYTESSSPTADGISLSDKSVIEANKEIWAHVFGAGIYEAGGSTINNYSVQSFTPY